MQRLSIAAADDVAQWNAGGCRILTYDKQRSFEGREAGRREMRGDLGEAVFGAHETELLQDFKRLALCRDGIYDIAQPRVTVVVAARLAD